MGYKTCSYCGAHLDPGEACDCRKDDAAPQQENISDEGDLSGKNEER